MTSPPAPCCLLASRGRTDTGPSRSARTTSDGSPHTSAPNGVDTTIRIPPNAGSSTTIGSPPPEVHLTNSGLEGRGRSTGRPIPRTPDWKRLSQNPVARGRSTPDWKSGADKSRRIERRESPGGAHGFTSNCHCAGPRRPSTEPRRGFPPAQYDRFPRPGLPVRGSWDGPSPPEPAPLLGHLFCLSRAASHPPQVLREPLEVRGR